MTANGRIIGTLSKEVVILHIIGEDHYLSDIEIAPELIVLEAFLHPFGLSLNAGIVILFLDLDECKWKTIDEQRNIGRKLSEDLSPQVISVATWNVLLLRKLSSLERSMIRPTPGSCRILEKTRGPDHHSPAIPVSPSTSLWHLLPRGPG